jgi:hypothetical protein
VNRRLLGTIVRCAVLVIIGAGFDVGLYWIEMYAPKFEHNPAMIYWFVVPLSAVFTALMCVMQWHYYKHPESE